VTIYTKSSRTKVNYRKIYEDNYGAIPRDELGRSYDIHHKDGDRSNNDPSNLVALSIQDHYDIHYQQGDFGACLLIANQRLNKSQEERSELARKKNAEMFANGNHPWQNKEWAKERSRKTVENGTHNFVGGEIQRVTNRRRVENGTHHLLNGDASRKYQREVVASGNHLFQNSEWKREQQKKLVDAGTHHLLGPDSPTQKEWSCDHCGKSGKGTSNYQRWHGENCKMFSPLVATYSSK